MHVHNREPSNRAAMSFFGFGQSADIDVVLNDAETRKKAEHKSEDGRKDKYFLFYDGETVSGKVNVTLKYPGKRLEHNGIKIEFIGQIGERLAACAAPRARRHKWPKYVGRCRGASYRRPALRGALAPCTLLHLS